MVAYRFEDSRSGDCAARHLCDYRGILQCDGYAGYRKLAGDPRANDLRLAGCWAHRVRRKFFDLHANGESVVATKTVNEMAQLWAVEDEVRDHPPEARQAARRVSSAIVKTCSIFGNANCRASPANPNSPWRSATLVRVARRWNYS
jgi:transposase